MTLNRLEESLEAIDVEVASLSVTANLDRLEKLVKEAKQYLQTTKNQLLDVQEDANKWRGFMKLLEER